MRAVVLCMNGITSSVFAAKMEKYSTARQTGWHFLPYRVDSFMDIVQQADLIILTPQAVPVSEPVTAYCLKHDVPYTILEEREFVTGDAEAVMKKIAGLSESVKKEEKHTLSFLQYLLQELGMTTMVFFLGFLFHMVSLIPAFSMLNRVYEMTSHFLVLFMVSSIGYAYGRSCHEGGLNMALLFTASWLIAMAKQGERMLIPAGLSYLPAAAGFCAMLVLAASLLRLFKGKTGIAASGRYYIVGQLDTNVVFILLALVFHILFS